jgi:hypothetical protein
MIDDIPALDLDAPDGQVRRVIGVARMLADVLYAPRSGRICELRHLSPASLAAELIVRPGDTITLAGVVQRRTGTGGEVYRDNPSTLWLVGDFDRPLQIAVRSPA